jgi:hypothetical protein
MKDERGVLIRIAFALILIVAVLAYARFLYSPLRASVLESYREHIALVKEKKAIAEIMADPGLISERITDMEGQLLETRPIKNLTPVGVVDDVTRVIDDLGLDLQSIVLGVPESPTGAGAPDAPTLLSTPLTIYMKASYDGGMYFVSSLEKSETGTYKIGGFSIRRPETAARPPDDGGSEAGGGASDGGSEGCDEAGGETGGDPIFDWVLTVYLLYYG